MIKKSLQLFAAAIGSAILASISFLLPSGFIFLGLLLAALSITSAIFGFIALYNGLGLDGY